MLTATLNFCSVIELGCSGEDQIILKEQSIALRGIVG